MNQINPLLESYINLFSSSGKAHLLNLQPGQIVKGDVLDLIDSKNALVLINNTKMIAKLEVPLVKDQSSWFIVTSAADEIKLKILTEQRSPTKPITNLQSLLNNLNIKNSSDNKLILNEMIRRDIPFDKALIENVSLLLKGDNNIDEVLQAVKFLKSKNIEISNPNIRAIIELFQNQDLFIKLDNVNKSIEKFLIDTNEESVVNKLTDNQIIDTSKNNTMDKTMTQLDKPIMESSIINIKGLPTEDVLSQITKTYKQIDLLINDFKTYHNEKDINSDLSKMINDKSLNETGKVDSKQILTNIVKFIDLLQQQFSGSSYDNNISKNLEQLLTHKNALSSELTTNIEKTINHLIGQNYAMAPEHSMFNQTIIQFPGFIPSNKNPVLIQIHTKKEEGSKTIDPDDMMLIFLFNLDNLGDVMVQIKIVQKQLLIQINNDNPNIKGILNILEPDFIDFIKNSGYQTSGLTVKSINKKQENNNSSFQSSYKGVDFKI
ncbi:MAG: hypothetical protein AB7V16_01865 [Vulcanibacillus sp.]